MLLWGPMLALIAIVPAPATAYLALVGAGIGVAVQDTGCFSLVTRLAGPAAGRVLPTMEMVGLAGLGTGSLVTPALLNAVGVRGTFALLGGGLAVLALAHAQRFIRLDRAMPAPGPEVRLLRSLPSPWRGGTSARPCTEWRKNSPRASKSVNWSKEAQAGDSSTMESSPEALASP